MVRAKERRPLCNAEKAMKQRDLWLRRLYQRVEDEVKDAAVCAVYDVAPK